MTSRHFVFAIPEKRLNSLETLVEILKPLLAENEKISLLFPRPTEKILRFIKKSDMKAIFFEDVFRDYGSVRKYEFPDFELSPIKEPSLFRIWISETKNSTKEIIRRMSRGLSLGYIDKLLERLLIYRVLFRANEIRIGLSLHGINLESDEVIFILEADRGNAFEFPLLYLRKKFSKARVVVLELVDSATEKDLLKFATESSRVPFLNRYKRKFSLLYRDSEYQGFHYYTIPELHAMDILGIRPSFPWRIGTNECIDITFLRRHSSVREYESLGILSKHVKYCGDVISDQLLENAKKTSRNTLKEGTSVLVALPQYTVSLREFSIISRSVARMQKEYFKFMQELSETAKEITICPHPKLNLDDFLYLEGIRHVSVSRESIHHKLPQCDYLVSTESSVIKFAWLLQKPVILYFPKHWKHTKMWKRVNATRPWTYVTHSAQDLRSVQTSDFFKEAEKYYSSAEYKNELKVELGDGKTKERLMKEMRNLYP